MGASARSEGADAPAGASKGAPPVQQKPVPGVLAKPAFSRGPNGSVEVNPLVMAGTVRYADDRIT